MCSHNFCAAIGLAADASPLEYRALIAQLGSMASESSDVQDSIATSTSSAIRIEEEFTTPQPSSFKPRSDKSSQTSWGGFEHQVSVNDPELDAVFPQFSDASKIASKTCCIPFCLLASFLLAFFLLDNWARRPEILRKVF